MKTNISTKNHADVTEKMYQLILKTLEDNKAVDMTTIDLRGRSSLADFLILVSGTSSRHLQSLAEYVTVALKKDKYQILGTEGAQGGDWVILDTGNIIVHFFRPEVRSFYQLEKMWDVNDAAAAASTENA